MMSLRKSPPRVRALAIAVGLLCIGLGAAPAAGESQLVLPFPVSFGGFPAATYDQSGERIGGAELAILRQPDGQVRIEVETGMDGGARTKAHAVLRPVAGKRGLVLVREQSESSDGQGKSLGLLEIDHETGRASCKTPAGDAESTEQFELPSGERVANVPLNLLFLPLVHGEVEEIEFQYFLCRGGARVMNFRAELAGIPSVDGDHRIIEVTYGPSLGKVVSWLASTLIPRLSFWFEADESGTYLAHRGPLFSKGPEVLVVVDGVSPTALR
jgi:hypothetical protein